MNAKPILRIFFLLHLVFLLNIFSACRKDDVSGQLPSLTNFAFLKQHNPGLTEDIQLTNYGQQIRGSLPYDADIEQLIATFDFTGSTISAHNKTQQSGITTNDFSQLVTYTVSAEDGSSKQFEVDARLFTGLPLFFINTDEGVEIESKEEYVSGSATIVGGRDYKDNSGKMNIRGRGHSTWYFHPKKPYQLKFDEKTEVFGMPAAKKWILLSEHSDKTLMRNKLAFEMGYISNLDWTPGSIYAEVFVNDDYRGTYTITQKVEEDEHRVNIGKGGFLLELDTPDHLNEDDVYFESNKFTIQIKEPELEFGSTEFNHIKTYIEEFENALFSENFTDPVTGYKSYIDVDSFVEWYLINEIAKNQDAKDYSSMYLHMVPGEKMKMGPIWDFDLGFGNVNYSECEFPIGYWVKHHAWISRMFEDPEFVSKVKERFLFFKNNESYLVEFIDNTTNILKFAQYENNERWEIYGNWIWPNPVVYDSHQKEVDHLKDWFSRRMKWLDEVYKSL